MSVSYLYSSSAPGIQCDARMLQLVSLFCFRVRCPDASTHVFEYEYSVFSLLTAPILSSPPPPRARVASTDVGGGVVNSSSGLASSAPLSASLPLHKRANTTPARLILTTGLHSFTSQLKLSAFYGIGGARRGCVAHVKGVFWGGCFDVSDTAQVELNSERV
jgi:hypothetical protein